MERKIKISNLLATLPHEFGNYRITKQEGIFSLYYGDVLLMGNSEEEVAKRVDIAKKAHGRVVFGGLGLGYTIAILKDNPDVSEIVCVEIDPVLVDAVSPYYPEATVITDDVFNYLKSDKPDTVILALGKNEGIPEELLNTIKCDNILIIN